jgi:adenylate cyclase
MTTKFIRVFGVFLIVLFCSTSIFFSLAQRDLTPIDVNLNKITSYPSFFEDRFYDIRMKMTMDEQAHSDKITFIKIDDQTLSSLGRWPMSRGIWARLMEKLKFFSPKVVAFDVFFSEPEVSCNEIKPDDLFAKSIKNFQQTGNHVIFSYNLSLLTGDFKTSNEFEEFPAELMDQMISSKIVGGKSLLEYSVKKDIWPLQTLLDQNPTLGHIQSLADADGIYRHYNIVANVEDLYFPSFALSIYQKFTGDLASLERTSSGEAYLNLANGKVGLNQNGQLKIRWFGDRWNFDEVSVKEIIEADPDDPVLHKKLNGKIAVIGATAFGLGDIRHSPINAKIPGPLFHINTIQMLLDGKFVKQIETSTYLSWWILFGGTLFMVIIQLFGKPILDIGVAFFLVLSILYYDIYHLTPEGYEVKLFFCLLSIIACYSWNTFLNFYLSNKDRVFLKSAFENYISPELIDEMYEKGEQPSLGGDKGILTAYFTDIESFSSFSEELSAEKLVILLNEYLTAMTDILLEERGTLDKYEGDAIVAFFGAPSKFADHAQRALRVAAIMQLRLNELREHWKSEEKQWPEIVNQMKMRVGINSGEIVTGNMGSTQRMNYTMMGDSVNLAARLEEAAKQYGIYIHFTEYTLSLVDHEDEFLFREIDTIRVVGKKEPVTTYELIGLNVNPVPEVLNLIKLFDEGRKLYKQQKWDEATEKFKESRELEKFRFPDLVPAKTSPSQIYINRCLEYKNDPPKKDWDGVYILTKK